MTNEEKEFIKKINVDKAKKKNIALIVMLSLSLLTYVVPLIFGEYDFGLIFEIITFIFVLVSRNYILKYDEVQAKKYNILAMIPIGWLLIYDIANICLSNTNILYILHSLLYTCICYQLLTLISLELMFLINKDLSKADNPIKYKESTDWFYEKYEKEEDKGK